MGKKYIVEIPEDKIADFVGSTHFLMPYMMAGHIGHHDTGLPIEPYTELDLEQVGKEAYEEGRKVGIKDGMCEAWEAAKKIIRMPEGDLLDLFDVYSAVCTSVQVMLKYDASEVIAKIKAWEDGKQEIKVGDIVRLKSAPEIEIWVTDISDEDGGRLSGLALKSVGDNCEIGDTYAYREIYQFEHTGKHYEIATVLKKMQEES